MTVDTKIHALITMSLLRRCVVHFDTKRFYSKTNRIREKLGIPLPPRRPLNPYLKFILNRRPTVVQSQPNLSNPDVTKVIAQEWAKYNPESKEQMKREYALEMQNYTADYQKYNESITETQKALIKSALEKKDRNKALAQIHEEWLKEVGRKWKTLSESDKTTYHEKAKTHFDKYKSELSMWEGDMIRLGHTDVVRSKELLNDKKSKTKKIE